MTNIIGVRFKKVGKVYHFDPNGLDIQPGMRIIVETARGIECGECTIGNKDISDDDIVKPLKKVIRIATEADLQTARYNEQQVKEAYEICKQKIVEHGLDMHLVSVECTFDLNKILFYFTADGRVDFRNLVKDLASVFRTRIELRQIGVRDEAKMVGGLGICGRELCCASYLEDFQPVSINMAKDQNLSLNPAKISGTCGRLMCCLKYEHEGYRELQKSTPRVDSLVETPEGTGTVVATQMLAGLCKVQLDGSNEPAKTFSCGECCTIRAGRAGGKRPPCSGGCCSNAAEAPAADDKPPRRERPEKRADRPERPQPVPMPDAPVQAAQDESAADDDKPRRRRRSSPRRKKKPDENA